MKTFEFSIVASGLDPEADGFADRFFDAGCDDATLSFQKGHIILDFARAAASLQSAIASAVEDVAKAGATVDRIEPDPLVSLIEIAARSGLTRQAITNYAKGERAKNFPAPMARVTADSSLWDWATVAKWMFKNKKIERDVAIEAEIVKAANAAITAGQTHLHEQLKKRAAEYAKELEAA